MTRRTPRTATAGLLIFLAIVASAASAEPQPKASDDDAAQLKAAQDERVKVLARLVDVLTGHYKLGLVAFAQVSSAENDLCNALLDSTDEPEKRVALLTKQLDKVNDLLKTTRYRRETAQVDVVDVYRAQAVYLDVKIKLLRERNRMRAPTPNPAGK